MNPFHHDIFRNLLIKAIVVHFFVNDGGNYVERFPSCAGTVIFDEKSLGYVVNLVYVGEDIARIWKGEGVHSDFIPL